MASNGSNGPVKKRTNRWSEPQPHEEYLELAAVSTAGDLTNAEQAKLQEHLAICADCRQALQEFASVADIAVPMLASELVEAPSLLETATPAENARAQLNDSLSTAAPDTGVPYTSDSKTVRISHRSGHHRTQVNWNMAWIPLAASILLTAALGIYSYRVGIGRGLETAKLTAVPANGAFDARSRSGAALEALEQQFSDAGHEREILEGQMAERDRLIKDLRGQIQAQSSALSEIRIAQGNLESSLQRSEAEKQQKIIEERKSAEERNSLDLKLETAEASLQRTQEELDSLRQQRSLDQSRSESLEAQIRDLHGQLRDREQTITKDEELLAHDRDIRELMGARDLYIAEVYDVGRDGATQKPYGRVFYTRGKSLIFYAYDLDQQPGAKTATFQAWGRRGPDTQQALNLGVFYKDTVGKKRWILKLDDPKTLDQIDAVFVTLEPNGQSHKPSGKSLLFAYLKVNPNHP
jgi:Putative zinc-finger